MLQIDLSGRTVLVTGAAKGIGKAVALTLASCGAKTALLDLDGAGVQRGAEEITAAGGTAVWVQADVTDERAVNDAVAQIKAQLGAVDTLVNVAAILIPRAPFYEIDLRDWEATFNVDVKGVFLCCRAVVGDMMAARRGKIVNIASVAGKIPRRNMAAYCSAKAAVIHLSKVLALELAEHQINVIAHCPGTTATDMVLKTLTGGDADALQKIQNGIPLGKLATPQEQANLIAFLVSDLADHITGQAINVDGGQVMW